MRGAIRLPVKKELRNAKEVIRTKLTQRERDFWSVLLPSDPEYVAPCKFWEYAPKQPRIPGSKRDLLEKRMAAKKAAEEKAELASRWWSTECVPEDKA